MPSRRLPSQKGLKQADDRSPPAQQTTSATSTASLGSQCYGQRPPLRFPANTLYACAGVDLVAVFLRITDLFVFFFPRLFHCFLSAVLLF